MAHMMAGGAAGAIASACTTPLDVIKTLLNTQETGIGVTKGMKEAMLQVNIHRILRTTTTTQMMHSNTNKLPRSVLQIYRMAGPLGFFKGVEARVLYSMPATAICWTTYEFFKYILSQQSYDQYRSTVVSINSGDSSSSSSSGGASASGSSSAQKSSKSDETSKAGGYVIRKPLANSVDGPPSPLPAISGTGVFNTLAFTTVHTDGMYDRKSGR